MKHDEASDYCYSCGHKLGDHRMSGRCDFYPCDCKDYIIKEDEEKMQNALDNMTCVRCGEKDTKVLGWLRPNDPLIPDFGDCWICEKCLRFFETVYFERVKNRICAKCHTRKSQIQMKFLPNIDVFGIGYTECYLCEDCLGGFDID